MEKSLILTGKEQFFQTEYHVSEFCKEHLFSNCIKFFCYGKFYRSGECFLLMNNVAVYQYLAQKKHQFTISFPKGIIKQRFNYVVSEDDRYSELMADAKLLFNLYYPLDSIYVHDDYYEMFCYASNINNPSMINYWLNHLNNIERFETYFKSKASALLTQGEAQRFYLPPSYHSNIFSETSAPKIRHRTAKSTVMRTACGEVVLTPRQTVCLDHLAFGLTVKEAAKRMNLSHRTVQDHIATIKSKLGCSRKSEVVEAYIKCKFINTFDKYNDHDSLL